MGQKYPDLLTDDVNHCISVILDTMITALSKKTRIEIRDFGNFDLKRHAPRKARNPKTGEELVTKAKYAIRFKMGKGLKNRINKI